MRFELLFTGQIPKDLDSPESCEDVFAISDDFRALALSDGASESFDSRSWASLIVDGFIKARSLSAPWIEQATKQYDGHFRSIELSWSKKAAFERGSFAALLGATLDPSNNTLRIFASGDCEAFIVRNNEIIALFPYSIADQFLLNPKLLSTRAFDNDFLITEDWVTECNLNIQATSGDVLILMSDALAHWFLRELERNKDILLAIKEIREESQLLELVLACRTAHSMKTDDTTLIVARILSEGDDGVPYS